MFRTLAAAVVVVAGSVAWAQAKAPPAAKDAGAMAGAMAAKDAGAEGKPALTVTQNISTPESVLYDPDSDTYLVSNIDGSPLAKDGKGHVLELTPTGEQKSQTDAGVAMNAPKGMAILAGVLYVADIDTVRMFDRATLAPKGEVKVPGATFLNDVAAGPDGKIYVSDSGLKQGAKDFEATGTDGIYVIEQGKKPVLKTLVKSKTLNRPNGLLVTADTIYVVTFGSNELQTLDLKGKKKAEPVKLPKGSLDGIVQVGDELIISSWEGKALYRGKPQGPFTEILGNLEAPADIGYDSKRNRVLVPRFTENRVEAWPLK